MCVLTCTLDGSHALKDILCRFIKRYMAWLHILHLMKIFKSNSEFYAGWQLEKIEG